MNRFELIGDDGRIDEINDAGGFVRVAARQVSESLFDYLETVADAPNLLAERDLFRDDCERKGTALVHALAEKDRLREALERISAITSSSMGWKALVAEFHYIARAALSAMPSASAVASSAEKE